MNTSEHNKKIYEDQFKKSQVYHNVHENKIKKMFSLINGNPKKILDIGCGDGWVGELLKKKYKAESHGIDIIEKALIKARNKGIITKKFDLSKKKWPYKNDFFDLIIAGDIIEHVYDTENFVKECKRILKKQGQLIISTPNINSYHNRLLVLIGKMPLWVDFAPNMQSYKPIPPSGHVRAFNKKTLTNLLKKYGLKIEEIKGAGFNIDITLMPKKLIKLINIANKFEELMSKKTTIASLLVIKAVKE